MADREPPSVRTGQKIRELTAGGDEDVKSWFIRLAKPESGTGPILRND